jgi:hypothetical protein
MGGRFAGYTLFVQGDALHFEFTYYMFETQRVSTAQLPHGSVCFGFEFDAIDERNGELRLVVDGTARDARQIAIFPLMTHLEPLEVGEDNHTPVSARYRSPYRYTGSITEARISARPVNAQGDGRIADGLLAGQ